METVKCDRIADGVSMTPLIFMHGFASSSTTYSGLCRELASHGYLVLVPDFQDGTCSYTENESGHEVEFDSQSKDNFLNARLIQLKKVID